MGGGGYGINTVPTPTVAITRAWLAHDTYNYRQTRERMHGMSAPAAPGMGTVIGWRTRFLKGGHRGV